MFDAYGTLLDVHAAMARHAARLGPDWQRISAGLAARSRSNTPGCAASPARRTTATSCADARGAGLRGRTPRHRRSGAARRCAATPIAGWPPTPRCRAMLRRLRRRGIAPRDPVQRRAGMLADAVRAAGIEELLDAVLSVEAVGVFKPDPRVYRLATERFGAGRRTQMAFFSSQPVGCLRRAGVRFPRLLGEPRRPAGRIRAARQGAGIDGPVRPARRARVTPAARIAAAIELLAASRRAPRGRPTRSPTIFSAPGALSARATGARSRSGSGACCARWRRLAWWLGARGAADAAAAGRRLAAAGGLGRWPASRKSFSGGRFAPAPLRAASSTRCARSRATRWTIRTMPRRGAAGSAGLDAAAPARRASARAAAEMAALRRAGAARPAGQPAEGDARGGPRGARGRGAGGDADAAFALGPAHRGPPRRSPPGAAFRAGLVEIQDEGSQLVAALVDARPGMRVADLVRRRRRQDAGAGDDDAEPRPARRLRRVGRAAGRRGSPAAPRRRAQRRAPSAGAGRQMGEAPRRQLRPRAGRCALHRHRHLAAQSRRAAAPDRGRSCRTVAQAGERSWTRPRRWFALAGVWSTLPARCSPRRTRLR